MHDENILIILECAGGIIILNFLYLSHFALPVRVCLEGACGSQRLILTSTMCVPRMFETQVVRPSSRES